MPGAADGAASHGARTSLAFASVNGC